MLMMAGSLFAVGACSYISRQLGAKEELQASRAMSTSFALAFAVGTIMLILGGTFIHPLVRLLGATPTCEQYSVEYATYVLLVAPLMASSFVMNQCLRAEGSALLSMIGMGFGGILNCFLDPLFIFRFGLGVKGASIATAISKLVSFLILIFPYFRKLTAAKLSVKFIHFEKKMLREILSVGSSAMFRTLLAVVSAIVLNNIAGRFSDSVLAGIGVSTKVMMFPFGIVLGFSQGFQPVAGYNWGAERYDRVRGSYRFSAVTCIVGSTIMGILLALFSDKVILLFSENDAELIAFGALCIRLQCLVLPVHGWVAVVNMFCAGLGYAKEAVLLSVSRQGICFLPFVYPFAMIWGSNGCTSIQAFADMLSLLLAVPIILKISKIVDKRLALQTLSKANTVNNTEVYH